MGHPEGVALDVLNRDDIERAFQGSERPGYHQDALTGGKWVVNLVGESVRCRSR